jgi:iron complex outermembrane receptor protein
MYHNTNNTKMSKLTPIATAAAILALSVSMAAQAQQAATEKEPEVVIVSGIRGSLQQSLSVKRNASSNVDVITAEDVGKMPDKNVADSLQRVPGVNISTSGAGSGGFDENDRVSCAAPHLR